MLREKVSFIGISAYAAIKQEVVTNPYSAAGEKSSHEMGREGVRACRKIELCL